MANYFNEEFETLPRAALEALQLKRLQSVAARVYARSEERRVGKEC